MLGKVLGLEPNLKNAFFEVGLVVIGILIAFQIDTWNNERQLRQKEIQYLSFIQDGLLSDRQRIESVIAGNDEKNKSVTFLFDIFSGEISNEEAVDALLAHVYVFGVYDVFIPNRIAFDNMVSAESIELISDRDLRILLSEYYSNISPFNGTQERVGQITRRVVDIMVDEFTHSGQEAGLLVFSNPGIRGKSEVTIHQNESFIGNLFLLQTVTQGQSDDLAQKLELIGRLLQAIEEQLGTSST